MTKSLFSGPAIGNDPAYINLRQSNDTEAKCIKEYVDNVWREWEPFADEQFPREFQDNFVSRFWEMYLGASLKDELKLVKHRVAGGPDICAIHSGKRVWIEAVAPTGGDPGKPDSVPEEPRGPGAAYIPEAQIILRITQAIYGKWQAYLSYRKKNIIKDQEPYIIAINTAQIPFGWAESDLPKAISAVYPFGQSYAVFDRETLDIQETGRHYRSHVQKHSGAPVGATLFLNSCHSGISGLIFAKLHAGHRFPPQTRCLSYVHNMCAANPLPISSIGFRREYYIKETDQDYKLEIVAR